MRPFDFKNLNPGDIIITDNLDHEDVFFDMFRRYRYSLYVVESCNKVDNAFIVSLGDRGYRCIVTKHGDEYVITSLEFGNPFSLANGAIYHYTAEEAEAANLIERAEAQDELRDFVCKSGGRNAPKSLEEAFDNLYAQHVPGNDHALTSVVHNETARGIMGEVVRGGISIARDLLEEDLKKIDVLIQEAQEARDKINQLATENTVALQPNSEAFIFTNPDIARPLESVLITGTVITVDDTEYLITRADESRVYVTDPATGEEVGYLAVESDDRPELHFNNGDKVIFYYPEWAYPALSTEDIEARKELTEKAKAIFIAFRESLKKFKKEMNYSTNAWENPMGEVDSKWDERRNNTIANILSLATYRVSQLKTARRELIKQANGYITQLEECYELAHGE